MAFGGWAGDEMIRYVVGAAVTAGLGIAAAAIAFVPLARADPTVGHDAKVNTQTPRMLCEIGSDDADPGIGPNVICQRGDGFAQTASDADQAFVTRLVVVDDAASHHGESVHDFLVGVPQFHKGLLNLHRTCKLNPSDGSFKIAVSLQPFLGAVVERPRSRLQWIRQVLWS